MKASVILDRAKRQLQDEGATRWTAPALLDYLNQARREVVKRRPQDFRARQTEQLVAGAEQAVPAGTAVFLGPIRNMGSDGATPGAVIRQVDRYSLDAFTPNWMADSGTAVKEYVPPLPSEQTYLVNPPVDAAATVHVEVELAAFFSDLTDDTGAEELDMSDRYETPLLYWVLHMAHAQETEESSAQKSADYYKMFRTELE